MRTMLAAAVIGGLLCAPASASIPQQRPLEGIEDLLAEDALLETLDTSFDVRSLPDDLSAVLGQAYGVGSYAYRFAQLSSSLYSLVQLRPGREDYEGIMFYFSAEGSRVQVLEAEVVRADRDALERNEFERTSIPYDEDRAALLTSRIIDAIHAFKQGEDPDVAGVRMLANLFYADLLKAGYLSEGFMVAPSRSGNMSHPAPGRQ